MTFKLLSLKTEAIHRETQDFPRKFRLFSQTTRVVTHCAWYVTVQLPEHGHPIVLRGDIPVGVIQEGGLGHDLLLVIVEGDGKVCFLPVGMVWIAHMKKVPTVRGRGVLFSYLGLLEFSTRWVRCDHLSNRWQRWGSICGTSFRTPGTINHISTESYTSWERCYVYDMRCPGSSLGDGCGKHRLQTSAHSPCCQLHRAGQNTRLGWSTDPCESLTHMHLLHIIIIFKPVHFWLQWVYFNNKFYITIIKGKPVSLPISRS